MSDSDDDMPPPLEDMSAQVAAAQAKKGSSNAGRAGASAAQNNA